LTISVIPTRTDLPNWDQITTLDGIDFQLGFRYNQRENVYYLIVADSTGIVLNGGIKLVAGWLLMSDFVDQRLPPGEIFVGTTGLNDSPPGLGELGVRGILYYADQAEVQAAGFDVQRYPLQTFLASLPH
jgi:hypothetical protein